MRSTTMLTRRRSPPDTPRTWTGVEMALRADFRILPLLPLAIDCPAHGSNQASWFADLLITRTPLYPFIKEKVFDHLREYGLSSEWQCVIRV